MGKSTICRKRIFPTRMPFFVGGFFQLPWLSIYRRNYDWPRLHPWCNNDLVTEMPWRGQKGCTYDLQKPPEPLKSQVLGKTRCFHRKHDVLGFPCFQNCFPISHHIMILIIWCYRPDLKPIHTPWHLFCQTHPAWCPSTGHSRIKPRARQCLKQAIKLLCRTRFIDCSALVLLLNLETLPI